MSNLFSFRKRLRIFPVLCTLIRPADAADVFQSLTATASNQPAPSTCTADADEVVVTATRIGVPRADLPQRVDVISSDDLKRTDGADLTDLLKKNASVDIVQYPGLSSVGLRGMVPDFSSYSKTTAILIDGRPAGTSNFSALPTDGIERIEILKGPASALYGGEAMGGVVNVITKDRQGQPVSSRLVLGVGSFGTWEAKFGSGGQISHRLDYDVDVSLDSRQDSFTAGDNSTIPYSSYNMDNLSMRLGGNLGQGWRLEARADGTLGVDIDMTNDVGSPYNAPNPGYLDLARYGGNLKLSGPLLDTEFSVLGYVSRDQSTDYLAAGIYEGVNMYYPSYGGDDFTLGGQMMDTFGLWGQTLTLGLDYRRLLNTSQAWTAPVTPPDYTDYSRTAPYSPDSIQHTYATFAQVDFQALGKRVTGNLGGRYDILGTELVKTAYREDVVPAYVTHRSFSPSGGIQVRPVEDVTVHASGGMAFVPPEASKLSLDALSYGTLYVGNPDLNPMTSRTVDLGIGLAHRPWGFSVDATLFWTDIDGDIVTQPVIGAAIPTYTYVNLTGTSELQGLELEWCEDLGVLTGSAWSLRIHGNLTHLFKARAAQSSVDDSRQINMMNIDSHKALVGLEFDNHRGFSVGVSSRFRGAILDYDYDSSIYPYPEVQYPSVWVYDMSCALAVGDGRRVRLFVDNLANVYYYEKQGYPEPGRAYKIEVSQVF